MRPSAMKMIYKCCNLLKPTLIMPGCSIVGSLELPLNHSHHCGPQPPILGHGAEFVLKPPFKILRVFFTICVSCD